MTIDPELKAKWLAALRSGEYKKGTGCLRSSNDEYCCLGVLADVIGIPWREKFEFGEECARKCYLLKLPTGYGSDIYLPEGISGIKLFDQHALAKINDESYSFDPVIKYIEAAL